jgi:hypothetical protein
MGVRFVVSSRGNGQATAGPSIGRNNQSDLCRLRRELRNANRRVAATAAEAHAALAQIRETLESLAPAGAVPNRLDASYRSEAQAIIRGIRLIADRDLAELERLQHT